MLNERGMLPQDEIEFEHFMEGELAVGSWFACRSRIVEDAAPWVRTLTIQPPVNHRLTLISS